nr:uncharacterized protein LOC105870710 isoform X3 [Microcebus murinus]
MRVRDQAQGLLPARTGTPQAGDLGCRPRETEIPWRHKCLGAKRRKSWSKCLEESLSGSAGCTGSMALASASGEGFRLLPLTAEGEGEPARAEITWRPRLAA